MNQNVKQFGKIGVLMGGVSSEREISLKSGKAIYEALQRESCQVVPIDINVGDLKSIEQLIMQQHIDIAFIALHGRLGEDGVIQALLEKLEIPYAGSGVKASQIAINKARTQILLQENGVNVSPFVVLTIDDQSSIETKLKKINNGWLVVKPACEGSSIGVSIIKDQKELGSALEKAWEYGPEVVVERYIKGREMTVGVFDGQALPVVEIFSKADFFDFTAKYQKGLTTYEVPASISLEATHQLQKVALKTFKVIGCEDFARIDFILSEDHTAYVLEINTIPGFTSTSLLPKAAEKSGISFDKLCVKIVQLAYGKKKTKTNTLTRN